MTFDTPGSAATSQGERGPGERSTFRLELVPAGYKVAEAGHGKATLDLIASTGLPDIITTDLMMPVMGGNELIRRLRAEPPTASIPIVVLSANAQAAEGLRAADGADAVMSKPFLSLNLVRLVEHLHGAVHQSPVTRRKS